MGNAAAFADLSAVDALADSGLSEEQISNIRTGIVAGSGGASSAAKSKRLTFCVTKVCAVLAPIA